MDWVRVARVAAEGLGAGKRGSEEKRVRCCAVEGRRRGLEEFTKELELWRWCAAATMLLVIPVPSPFAARLAGPLE